MCDSCVCRLILIVLGFDEKGNDLGGIQKRVDPGKLPANEALGKNSFGPLDEENLDRFTIN